jgi:ring-1,2-phenylacetyl-CoA epoxidase subunit PaaC
VSELAASMNAVESNAEARFRYVLRLADTGLILAQRLGEWIGKAPALEEELGLANTALDLLGQARLFFNYAAELEGCGRTEDDLAFLRDQSAYLNFALVEQPNGDFAQTMVRQFLIDAYLLELYEALQHSADSRVAEIAAKAVKEARYHARYSAGWLVRLGDGTEESHMRSQRALDTLWSFVRELFDADELDTQMAEAKIAPSLDSIERLWSVRVDEVLKDAMLKRPAAAPFKWYGKRGEHGEHLGYLLADLQYMQRAYPGAIW